MNGATEKAADLRRMAAEMVALAEQLEESAAGGTVTRARAAPVLGNQAMLTRAAMQLLAMRESRSLLRLPGVLGEPAWDILLALYIETARGRRVQAKWVMTVNGTPASTSLRYFDLLEEAGFVVADALDREGAQPHDGAVRTGLIV